MTSDGIYIQMHSMHGLFRSKNLELGRDEDTGGQIVYVLELAKAFGRHPDVDKVDILTRRIKDPDYPGYSKKKEKVSDDNVNIIRIECGPDKYIKKVNLWPHIEEFVDNTKKYIEDLGRKPDVLHSNYADAGYVCTLLSKDLGIPQVHTGHSLGKPKMQRLDVNNENYEKMDEEYSFTERIMAEESTIDHASAIITSTREERLNQYRRYHIHMDNPKFHVVAPGIDIESFNPPGMVEEDETQKESRQKINRILEENLDDTEKPLVLALSRLEYRKNVIGLVKAFAFDEDLQEKANLAVFVGRFKNFGENQKHLLEEIQNLMEKKKLEDRICLPDAGLDFERDVPLLYRIAAEKKGVFVNPALIEPFGLTILEAAASGLPVVATENGGPSEIITRGENGLLVDPRHHGDIAEKVKKILDNSSLWEKFSKKGRKNVLENYTWQAAAQKEVEIFKQLIPG